MATGPIKIVNCLTWGVEAGNGIARMDSILYRFLDKSRFQMVMAVPAGINPDQMSCDPSIPYVYTGEEDRFGELVKIFSGADIVQYSGGFQPLVAEAAAAARVPALIEVMHHLDVGQIDDGIDATVCASQAVRRMQPFPERCAVIRNGIDIAAFPYRPKPADGKIVILQASNRIKPTYNLDELADGILPLDPRIELWIAGPGQTGRSTDRVKFLGLVSGMAGLYAQADMLVLLSKVEAFGLVVAEAMASGVIPVAWNKDGPAEIISGGVDGFLVPPDDRKGVTEAIRRAVGIRGTADWDKLRRAAREKIEREFSAERYAAGYGELYEKIAEKKGRRKTPGPQTAPAPPEADVADAIFHYRKGEWDMVEKSLEKLAARQSPLTKPAVAQAADRLARHAIIEGKPQAANAIYQKLFSSGFRDAEWMGIWFKVCPKDSLNLFPLDDFIDTGGAPPEVYMLSAERALDKGNASDALRTLEKGAGRYPDSAEIVDTLALLKARMEGK
ncbi:MAG: glycosyltransferase family 4 protein [Nitrospinae bacterium]|nr:glycosyltransferase family 4 protein [Nitrospinota bacterium]